MVQIAPSMLSADYAALRRALIEYRFMERTPDGSVYRATTNTEI